MGRERWPHQLKGAQTPLQQATIGDLPDAGVKAFLMIFYCFLTFNNIPINHYSYLNLRTHFT
ncbi:hypothetical protein Hanom_Chr01g00080611 [Helianthus anomalus]